MLAERFLVYLHMEEAASMHAVKYEANEWNGFESTNSNWLDGYSSELNISSGSS